MAAVAAGSISHGSPSAIGQYVARPQVAVQPRRRLARARTARSIRSQTRSSASTPPSLERAALARQAAPAAAGAAPRRTRASRSHGSFGRRAASRSQPRPTPSKRPKRGAPASCRRASPRPSSSAPAASALPARSTRARDSRSPASSTRGTRSAPGLGQPPQPGRLARVLARRRRPSRVFTNASRPSASTTRKASLMSPPPIDRDLARARRQAHARALGADLLEQAGACRLHEVEHVARSRRPRRSRGRARRGRSRPTLAGSNSRSSLTFARLSASGASARRSRRFARVHREDQVKALEVLGPHLPRGSVEHDAPARRCGRRALVRRAADVPAAGAGRVELDLLLETRLAHERAHHALGRRRAADVAEADEQHADRLALGARASPRRRARARRGTPPAAPRRGRPASCASCPPSASRAAFSCA